MDAEEEERKMAGRAWARERLISDARLSGYDVIECNGVTTIRQRPGSVAITIWSDNTAVRADVRNDLQLAIRSFREMRRILGLDSLDVGSAADAAEERRDSARRGRNIRHRAMQRRW